LAVTRRDAIAGCLLGTAVGDAIGLPFENLSKSRQARLCPKLDGPRLLFGRGMISDDTEHACLTAQALIAAGDNAGKFERALARQLRIWFLCVAPGAGLATLKACLRLCCGVSPQHSGIFSAGNGPAMRSPMIGVASGHDRRLMRELVAISTRMTHSDPKAEQGALAAAVAAQMAATKPQVSPATYLSELVDCIGDCELTQLVARGVDAAVRGEGVAEFAASLGLERGVSGYIFHTVPVALYAWFRHPCDLRSAILETVRCGGDTDSTGALAGAIVGASVGRAGIPAEWLNAMFEWPRSVHWMERLAGRLEMHDAPAHPLPLFIPAVTLRNLFFLTLVLGHGLRRIFPPY